MKVTYDVEGFSDKNKDTLFGDLVESMQCSSNPFLVGLFPENVSNPQKKRPTTAGYKIKVLLPFFFSCSSSIVHPKLLFSPHVYRLQLLH